MRMHWMEDTKQRGERIRRPTQRQSSPSSCLAGWLIVLPDDDAPTIQCSVVSPLSGLRSANYYDTKLNLCSPSTTSPADR